jgi:hypothetical protein
MPTRDEPKDEAERSIGEIIAANQEAAIVFGKDGHVTLIVARDPNSKDGDMVPPHLARASAVYGYLLAHSREIAEWFLKETDPITDELQAKLGMGQERMH